MSGISSASDPLRARFELVDGRGRAHVRSTWMGLTVRELQVIDGIVRAESTRTIAARLSLSPHTVGHHLTSIFAKLGVRSRVQLAVVGIKQRFLEMETVGGQM